MADRTTSRAGQERIRQWCHQVVDQVTRQAENKLQAAERALDQAPDDAARQMLLEIVVSAPDEVTAAFVRAAVRRGPARLARAAADLLIDVAGTPDAAAAMGECLQSSDPSVRRRAVEALETVRDPAAAELLTRALRDSDPSVQRAAANSLGLIIGSKYHALKGILLGALGDLDSALARAVVGSEDVQLRRELAQALGYEASEQLLPLLERLSSDPDEVVRRESVVSLAAHRTGGAAEVLSRKLEDPDYFVVASALDALASHYGRNSEKTLEFLRIALRHPAREVRRHAVLMLDRFGPRQMEEALEAVRHDPDFEVLRSAHEMLRRAGAESAASWFGKPSAEQSSGEQTLLVWEAGNLGSEWQGAQNSPFKRRGATTAADVVPVLEGAAMGGDASVRVHAVSELVELEDVADSEALRKALDDRDESVRSRAAAGLLRTRDAGLLARILQSHPDPLVRRNAVTALIENPAGRADAGASRRRIQFAAMRTVGTELLSRFLAALDDPDEDVKTLACRGISRYVTYRSPLPVRRVLAAVRDLAEQEDVSSLVRDTASETAEAVAEAALAAPLVKLLGSVLEWRGQLARQAHALRRDAQSGRYVLDRRGGLTPEDLAKRWPVELGVRPEQAQAAAEALAGASPLPDDAAQAAMRGMVRGLMGCLEAVHHAARAVGLIGEARWGEDLAKWGQAMQGGPGLEWGEDETVRGWQRALPRLRRRAAIAVKAAREALADRPDPAALDEDCADQDDWVRLAALTARAELAPGPARTAGGPAEAAAEMAGICRAHAQDADYAEVVGPAAATLLAAGHGEVVAVIEGVLQGAPTGLRQELVQRLMSAAEEEAAARALRTHLEAGPVDGLGRLTLAMALRGAGGSLEGLAVPDSVPEGSDVELDCALCGLKAMTGDSEAVARLEERLRQGQERPRFCAAVYLGLARVHSALPVFAAVSDQDVSLGLRSFCGGMLVRRGHQLGAPWFGKVGQQPSGPDAVRLAIELARAVEDVVPLMLRCTDVNLGRFV